MPLSLALFYGEQLPPIVRDELQQLIASLQAQLGQPAVAVNRSILVPTIQRGTLTILSGAASGTAALPTPISDMAKTEVRLLGFDNQNAASTPPKTFVRLALTSTTTLTANIGAVALADFTISWEVTEWVVTPEAGSI